MQNVCLEKVVGSLSEKLATKQIQGQMAFGNIQYSLSLLNIYLELSIFAGINIY